MVMLAAMVSANPPVDASVAKEQVVSSTDRAPRWAEDFRESVGINTHLFARNTSYEDINRVVSSLSYIGIKNVREDPFEGSIPFSPSRLKALTDLGVKLDIDGGGADLVPDIRTEVEAAKAIERMAPGSVFAVEGYNEVDDQRHPARCNGFKVDARTGDYRAAAEAQKRLYALTRQAPALRPVAVLPYTFAWCTRSSQSPDVSGYADFANVHAYCTEGGVPRRSLAAQIAGTMQVRDKNKPVMVTETGYPTIYPGYPTLKNLIAEQVQEKLLLDTLCDEFQAGIVKTYLYELLDRRANKNTTDQAHYGVFRFDGTPKPAAMSIRRLLKLLDEGTPAARGSAPLLPLDFTLTSNIIGQDHAPNYDLVLQKKSGAYDIVIWSEPRIWNAPTFTMRPRNGVDTVTVKLSKTWSKVDVHDPTLDEVPIKSEKNSDEVSVAITDHPIVIEVTP